MKKRLSSLLYAAITGLLFLTLSARADNSLHADMLRGLRAEGLSGAVWALVTPEGGVTTGAAGFKHAANREPMRPDTRVMVGSMAKSVLAAGVLRLVTTGQLTLDADVAALLPTLDFENPWSKSDPIRVRHLLAHTAGLENFRFSQVFSLEARVDTPLSAALARTPSMLRVRTRPGTQYAYSNTGYLLLGMVIEAVTGGSYERYLDTQLLQPLGMRDSTFGFTTQSGPGADPRLAMGHFENGVSQQSLPMFLRPAGQFTTTAADMARFAIFLMGNGEVDGQAFIAPQLRAAISRPTGTEAAVAGLSAGHGLAFAVRDRHQVVGSCHPGTSVGFRAMLCLYPDQGKAFFVSVNADSETADYERFNRTLIAALQLPQRRQPALAVPAPQGIEQWQGIYVPAWNAVASLAWVDTVFNFVSVRWNGKSLQVDSLQQNQISLRPAGGLLFQAEDRTEPSHVLFDSADGGRILSDGLRSYRKVEWPYMIWLWTSVALGLAGLFYVLVSGLWQLARGRMHASSVLAAPLASVLALVLPIPFFISQSFLQLGDRTMASVLLAVVTALLTMGMGYGLIRLLLKRDSARRQSAIECAALLAVLQWLIVLAAWGMIPFILWQ